MAKLRLPRAFGAWSNFCSEAQAGVRSPCVNAALWLLWFAPVGAVLQMQAVAGGEALHGRVRR